MYSLLFRNAHCGNCNRHYYAGLMGSKCDYCGYGGGYGDSDSDSDGDSDSDLDSDSSEKVIKYFDTLEDDY